MILRFDCGTNRILQKALALIMVQVFLFTNIAYPEPSNRSLFKNKRPNYKAIQERREKAIQTKKETLKVKTPKKSYTYKKDSRNDINLSSINDISSIYIPDKLGRVVEVYDASSDDSRSLAGEPRLIVHIQDLHTNPEGQLNMASILEILIKNHNMNLVCSEGAEGVVDTSSVSSFPDAEVRERTARLFIESGELTGEEYLSITKYPELAIWGIENKEIYFQNIVEFNRIQAMARLSQVFIDQVTSALNKLKPNIYSKKLLEVDSKAMEYEEGTLPTNEYLGYLIELGGGVLKDTRFKNVALLRETIEAEKDIDQEKVRKESHSLLLELQSALEAKGRKSEIETLLAKATLFKDKRVTPFSFYSYLDGLARRYLMGKLDEFQNLLTFVEYLKKVNSLDSMKLFYEIDQLYYETKDLISIDEDQKLFTKVLRHIGFLEDFFNLKISNEELDYYNANKEDFRMLFFKELLKKNLARYNIDSFIDFDPYLVDDNLSTLENFYKIAHERDIAMSDNAIAEIQKRDVKVSALIAGGFHTRGLTKIFRERGFSYVIIAPHSSTDIDEENYRYLLSGKRKPITELIDQMNENLRPMLKFADENFKNFIVSKEIRSKDKGINITFTIHGSHEREDLVRYFEENIKDALARSNTLYEGSLPENITIILASMDDLKRDKSIILNTSRLAEMIDRGERPIFISELIRSILSEKLAYERGAKKDPETELKLAEKAASNTLYSLVDQSLDLNEYISFLEKYGSKVEGQKDYIGYLNQAKDFYAEYKGLYELSQNLYFQWNYEVTRLFEDMSPEVWNSNQVDKTPFLMLQNIGIEKFSELLKKNEFMDSYRSVMKDFRNYMDLDRKTWLKENYPELAGRLVGYSSLEMGVFQNLQSGGLGALAGDHIKEASDKGFNFTGIGLMYTEGYFTQEIDRDGNQIPVYSDQDFKRLPKKYVMDPEDSTRELLLQIPMYEHTIYAKVFKVNAGRAELFLLTTDIEENEEWARWITKRLYTGDKKIDFEQAYLLGIGQVILMQKLDINPEFYHMNESHAAFVVVGLIKDLMDKEGLSFEEALITVYYKSLFTIHTPISAGNWRFAKESLRAIFNTGYLESSLLDLEKIILLGEKSEEDEGGAIRFDLAQFLNLCGLANGVSEEHGEVSRKQWGTVIGEVLNGIHIPYWQSPEMQRLIRRKIAGVRYKDRTLNDEKKILDRAISDITDEELWEVHTDCKRRLGELVRDTVKKARQRNKETEDRINDAKNIFDDKALTIVIARRFAAYKRSEWLLSADMERITNIIKEANKRGQKVQIIFAGKAHPQDNEAQDGGVKMIRRIHEYMKELETDGVKNQLIFLENYNLDKAHYLVQGADVWLSYPKTDPKPLEASGTSGQKLSVNGGINAGIPTGFMRKFLVHMKNAFLFKHITSFHDDLERFIIPQYYAGDMPSKEWMSIMRESLRTGMHHFGTDRMISDYTRRYYSKGIEASEKIGNDKYQLTKAVFKAIQDSNGLMENIKPPVIVGGAKGIDIIRVLHPDGTVDPIDIEAEIELGDIPPEAMEVSIVFKRADGEDQAIQLIRMDPERVTDGVKGVWRYRGEIEPLIGDFRVDSRSFEINDEEVFDIRIRVRPIINFGDRFNWPAKESKGIKLKILPHAHERFNEMIMAFYQADVQANGETHGIGGTDLLLFNGCSKAFKDFNDAINSDNRNYFARIMGELTAKEKIRVSYLIMNIFRPRNTNFTNIENIMDMPEFYVRGLGQLAIIPLLATYLDKNLGQHLEAGQYFGEFMLVNKPTFRRGKYYFTFRKGEDKYKVSFNSNSYSLVLEGFEKDDYLPSSIGKLAEAQEDTLILEDDGLKGTVDVYKTGTEKALGALKLQRVKIDAVEKVRESSFIEAYLRDKHKELFFSIMSLFEKSPPVYTFGETLGDLFGFASSKHALIVLHEKFLQDDVALFHELLEYLVRSGKIDLKYQEDKRIISVIYFGGRETKELVLTEESAIKQALKDPVSPHYLLRALQRELFNELDEFLTEGIKKEKELGRIAEIILNLTPISENIESIRDPNIICRWIALQKLSEREDCFRVLEIILHKVGQIEYKDMYEEALKIKLLDKKNKWKLIDTFGVRELTQYLKWASMPQSDSELHIPEGVYRSQPAERDLLLYPNASEVPSLMKRYFQWLKDEEEKITKKDSKALHPVELASRAFYRFFFIQPFEKETDNMLAARKVMNYILMKNAFPAFVLDSSNEREFARILRFMEVPTKDWPLEEGGFKGKKIIDGETLLIFARDEFTMFLASQLKLETLSIWNNPNMKRIRTQRFETTKALKDFIMALILDLPQITRPNYPDIREGLKQRLKDAMKSVDKIEDRELLRDVDEFCRSKISSGNKTLRELLESDTVGDKDINQLLLHTVQDLTADSVFWAYGDKEQRLIEDFENMYKLLKAIEIVPNEETREETVEEKVKELAIWNNQIMENIRKTALKHFSPMLKETIIVFILNMEDALGYKYPEINESLRAQINDIISYVDGLYNNDPDILMREADKFCISSNSSGNLSLKSLLESTTIGEKDIHQLLYSPLVYLGVSGVKFYLDKPDLIKKHFKNLYTVLKAIQVFSEKIGLPGSETRKAFYKKMASYTHEKLESSGKLCDAHSYALIYALLDKYKIKASIVKKNFAAGDAHYWIQTEDGFMIDAFTLGHGVNVMRAAKDLGDEDILVIKLDSEDSVEQKVLGAFYSDGIIDAFHSKQAVKGIGIRMPEGFGLGVIERYWEQKKSSQALSIGA